jgi:hypothetical protein
MRAMMMPQRTLQKIATMIPMITIKPPTVSPPMAASYPLGADVETKAR